MSVFGLVPPQRLRQGGDDSLAAGAAAVGIAGIEAAEELRGDDDAIALAAIAANVVADDLLGMSLGVDVGGVDEISAAVQEARDDRFGLRDAGSPAPVLAEGHRA